MAAAAQATESLSVTAYRPDASSWSRTKCGAPGGDHPATPPGPYTEGVDHAGGDMPAAVKGCAKPYENGCVLQKSATHLDCETKCNATKGCVLYVFADANCSGQAGPVCWLKSTVGPATPGAPCRASRSMGAPATKATDIPTKWGLEITASSTPWPAYPRPQMARGEAATVDELRDTGDASTWTNLNGLWEWEPTTADAAPAFGKKLAGSILVPFPVESCLSGVAPHASKDIVMNMWYRLVFDVSRASTQTGVTGAGGKTLLHFGAIDWQSAVYLNGKQLGNHTGGYDGFSYDITDVVVGTANELLVFVHDPSETGKQPNGKQRSSAISSPGGDTYTPSSGIWQTPWLEAVPAEYISGITIDQGSVTAVTVSAEVEGGATADTTVKFEVIDATGTTVATATARPSDKVSIVVPGAQLWSTTSPYLYDLKVSTSSDSITSYFGLRTFALGDGPKGKRPLLNGKFTFAAGFLDQSFFPDGLYTAPSDDALAYDIQVVPMFGMNMIRLHQKVNPERWYYHADKLGVLVFQDMVQKYGGADEATIPYFIADFKAMVKGRGNHPSIVQFTTFNEGDCWAVFKNKPWDVAAVVALAKELAPNRLIDTDSGGGANNQHIGDVNDIHSYPWPGDPQPSTTQYAMIGEFGGIGAFQEGHMWTASGCFAYLHTPTAADEADTYVKMAAMIQNRTDHISASVFTQTTDLERECDGFLNYDRTNKFNAAQTKAIHDANQAIINSAAAQ